MPAASRQSKAPCYLPELFSPAPSLLPLLADRMLNEARWPHTRDRCGDGVRLCMSPPQRSLTRRNVRHA